MQLEQALSLSRTELYRMNEELATSRSNFSVKMAWVQDLEEQLRRKTQELETSQAICQESDQAVRELEGIQLQAVEELERKQRSELEAVRQHLQSLEIELKASREGKAELEQEQGTMIRMCKEVEQKNMELRHANLEMEGKIARCQKELAELHKLHQQAAKFKDPEQNFYDLQKDAEERVQALERSMEKAEMDAQRQLAAIREKHAAEIDEMIKSNETLQEAKSAGEEALAQCGERLQEVTALYQTKQKSMSELQETVIKLEGSSADSQDFDAELQRMREQLEDANAQRKQLEHKVSAADEEHQNLQKRLLAAEKGQAEAKQRSQNLEQRCAERDEEVKTLRELDRQRSAEASKELRHTQLQEHAEEERRKLEAELEKVRELARSLEQQQKDALVQLENSEQKCKQKNVEIKRYQTSLYQAETAAADSEAELANCRAKLVEEGKELEIMMEEVCELQKAVMLQTSQHGHINEELLSAQARVKELESTQDSVSDSLRPIRAGNSLGRVLGWLHFSGRSDVERAEGSQLEENHVTDTADAKSFPAEDS